MEKSIIITTFRDGINIYLSVSERADGKFNVELTDEENVTYRKTFEEFGEAVGVYKCVARDLVECQMWRKNADLRIEDAKDILGGDTE